MADWEGERVGLKVERWVVGWVAAARMVEEMAVGLGEAGLAAAGAGRGV